MKVLSLFDGISTLALALDKVGIPVERYVAYEIEPNAIKISEANYPNIEHRGDVTKADFTEFKGFDLLAGGFPCQSLSITQSKTRQDLNGKSKLFFELVRAIKEVQPKYFLVENVASMKAECKDIISNMLGCEPVLINSADFSAQSRPRLYWTNIPVDMDYKKSTAVLKDIMQQNVPERYYYSFPLADVDMSKQVCATLVHNNHEIHKRVFNPEFKCHTLTCVSGGNQQKKVIDHGRARKLTPLEYERLQTLPDNYTEFDRGGQKISDSARYTVCGNSWTVDVIAHILKGIKEEI